MARIDTLKNFLVDIADKLREKLGTDEKIYHADYDIKIDEVYEAGKNLEYNKFWDNFQSNGNRGNYEYAFSGEGWNDETLKPKYPLTVTSGTLMFRGCAATCIPEIDLRNWTDTQSLFAHARKLVTIEKIILKNDGSNTFASPFIYCEHLTNISFEGIIGNTMSIGHSKLLTNESVQNIIDHLKDLTDADTKTITFHSAVGSKLTDKQISDAQNKNWTLVY